MKSYKDGAHFDKKIKSILIFFFFKYLYLICCGLHHLLLLLLLFLPKMKPHEGLQYYT